MDETTTIYSLALVFRGDDGRTYAFEVPLGGKGAIMPSTNGAARPVARLDISTILKANEDSYVYALIEADRYQDYLRKESESSPAIVEITPKGDICRY